MRLYEVTFEVPGYTVKAPGVSETELKCEQTYYAADSVVEVWDAIQPLLTDPERIFLGIVEKMAALTVLSADGEPK